MEYSEFISNRAIAAQPCGMNTPPDVKSVFPLLFDWQAQAVGWALRLGKAALFEDCGLGKTFQQLAWAQVVCEHTGGQVLILAPLAVTKQTAREAVKLGVDLTVCRTQDDVRPGVNITNYEMLDHFESASFVGVVLDESSILKSYMGKTKRSLIESFKDTPWKLACTATPSPNDHMELLNHAAFLDVMASHEALAIWFINTDESGKYRLKRHAEADFWRWVSSWAMAIGAPSDLGYDDDGFVLPVLHVVEHVVETDPTVITVEREQCDLFRVPEMNATSFHREKRVSVKARAQRVAELARTCTGRPVAIWCETNYEADAILEELPDAIEVRGNHSSKYKEKVALDFADGKVSILVSKASIFGFGMNFQVCHDVILCGLDFSFERYYQLIRRFWRFGQEHEVTVHVVIGDGEHDILAAVRRKESDHEMLKKSMVAAVSAAHRKGKELVTDYQRQVYEGENWTLVNADCVDEVKRLESGSVDFTVFSPPFSTIYVYSDSLRDMGNAKRDDDFFAHFNFLIPELYRVTRFGRLCAVHCKDLVDYKVRDGRAGLRDFPGEIIRAFESHGWKYHSRVTIWTDPVLEMQRTKAHGLLYKQLRADGSFSRQGLPDYLLAFRKWPESEEEQQEVIPVRHTRDGLPLEVWQNYASPVWMDVRRTDVLNTDLCRNEKDEKHICPLQLSVVRRAVELWSNPGELVFSPFAGIGSEGVESLRLGRKFYGVELKPEYAKQAMRYLSSAVSQLDLLPQLQLAGGDDA